MRNNKKRLLSLLKILIRQSDGDTHLNLEAVNAALEEEGFEAVERKTLYDDIKVLNSMDIDIEYEKGYYLLEAPFSLSEIKLLQDCLYSLKSLDEKTCISLCEKLSSFLSKKEEDFLKELSCPHKISTRSFLPKVEMVLEAKKKHGSLIVRRKNDKEDEIFPLFLMRENDFYYFYYHYPQNKKIYHMRFDNILSLKQGNSFDTITVTKEEIIAHIEASSSSFYKENAQSVLLLTEDEKIRDRLKEEFPNSILTKEGVSIKVSVNDVFFGRLAAYGNSIRIKEKAIADRYCTYLNKILENYLP